MKKSRIIFISLALAVAVVAVMCGSLFFKETPRPIRPTGTAPRLVYEGIVPYDQPIKSYRKLLCDKHDVQLPAARRLGIEPQTDKAQFDSLTKANKLVKVLNSKYLYVKADYPYLIPEAYDLLLEIGRRYQEKTHRGAQLKVTSCLRTHQSIKKSRNPNKVKHSCHLYGTTFDISYKDMPPAQKEALVRVLQELRAAGYLYVIYERRQPCFHITLRRAGKDPEQA